MNAGTIECDTIQLIEPQSDFLVDTAGTTSDIDERGQVALNQGQTAAIVYFVVPKLTANYHFEYLYVGTVNESHPGTVICIPTIQLSTGFGVRFAGSPLGPGYTMYWRVTVVKTSSLLQIDAPENLSILMPSTNLMTVPFTNPRAGTDYGFSELRVENLTDPPSGQAIIRVQVVAKTVNAFTLAVNPTPAINSHYFLKARTP